MEIDLKQKGWTLQEAIQRAKPNDILLLEDKTYVEKIIVTTPYLTLVGKQNTKISYGDCATFSDENHKPLGTTKSATFSVKEEATHFQAQGIIFENSYIKNKSQSQNQAVAFKSESSYMHLKDCRFIGRQDTFYVDYGKMNLVENCEIEGDVDFIFGSADCLFRNCRIKAIALQNTSAYFTAPDTYQSNLNGLVFEDCSFSCEGQGDFYLGRPWFPTTSKEKVYPRITLIRCSIPERVHLFLKKMHSQDPTGYDFHIIDCQLSEEEFL